MRDRLQARYRSITPDRSCGKSPNKSRMEDADGDSFTWHTDDRPGLHRHNNADDVIPRPRRIRRQNTNSTTGGDGPWASSGTRNNADDIIPRPRGRRKSTGSADMNQGVAARRRNSDDSRDMNYGGVAALRRNSGESSDDPRRNKGTESSDERGIGQRRYSDGNSVGWNMDTPGPRGPRRVRSPEGWRSMERERERVRERERAAKEQERELEREQERERERERERRVEREKEHERRKALEEEREREREREKEKARVEEMERRREREREHERRQEKEEREKKDREEREKRETVRARRRVRCASSSSSDGGDGSEDEGRERSYGSRGVLDRSAKLSNRAAKRDLSPVATRCERPKLRILKQGQQSQQGQQGQQSRLSQRGQQASSESSDSSDSEEQSKPERKPGKRRVIRRPPSSRGDKRSRSKTPRRRSAAPRSREVFRRSRERKRNASVRKDEFGRAIISRSRSPSRSAPRRPKNRRLDSRRRSNSRRTNDKDLHEPIFLLVKSRDCGRIIGSKGSGLRTLAQELKDDILRDHRAVVEVLCQPFEERDRITDERFVRIIGIPSHLRQDAIDHILLLVHECRDQHGETLKLSEERRVDLLRDRAASENHCVEKPAERRRVVFSISNRDCGKIIADGLRNVARELVNVLDDRRVTFDKLLISIQSYADRKKESDARQVTVFGVPPNLETEVQDFFRPKVEYMENEYGEVIQNANPDAITEYVRIPQIKVGLLLGIKGITIKRLQEASSVHLTLNQKTKDEGYSMLEIEGCKKNIAVAKKLLDDLLSGNRIEGEPVEKENGDARGTLRGLPTFEMRVSQGKVGLLLGTKGATIRRLQEDAKVDMILDQKTKHEGYSILIIEGKKEDIKEARALVDELLCVNTNPTNPYQDPAIYESKRNDGSQKAEHGRLPSPAAALLPLSTPPPYPPPEGTKPVVRPGLMPPSMMPPPMMLTSVVPSMFIAGQRPHFVQMTPPPPFDLHRCSVRPGGMSLVTAPYPGEIPIPVTSSGLALQRPHMDCRTDAAEDAVAPTPLPMEEVRRKVNYNDL